MSETSIADVGEFIATMKSYGHTDERIQQAIAEAGLGTPETGANGATTTTAEPGQEPVQPGSRYSQNDIDEFVEAMHAAGQTPEQIEAALRAQGLNVALAPPAPDPRTDAVKDLDEQFPPPRADDLRFAWNARLPAGEDITEANTDAKAFVLGSQLPAAIGQSLVEIGYDAMNALAKMSEVERIQWKEKQMEISRTMSGGTDASFDKLATDALRGLGNAKQGKLWVKLVTSGANYDAALIMNLARHGERQALRKGN